MAGGRECYSSCGARGGARALSFLCRAVRGRGATRFQRAQALTFPCRARRGVTLLASPSSTRRGTTRGAGRCSSCGARCGAWDNVFFAGMGAAGTLGAAGAPDAAAHGCRRARTPRSSHGHWEVRSSATRGYNAFRVRRTSIGRFRVRPSSVRGRKTALNGRKANPENNRA